MFIWKATNIIKANKVSKARQQPKLSHDAVLSNYTRTMQLLASVREERGGRWGSETLNPEGLCRLKSTEKYSED